MAFGGLKGTLTGNAASITNPIDATGSVAVIVGDLVFGVIGEQTSLTATTVTDNLGNTYAATNNGTDAGTSTGRAYYSRVTVAGTLTAVHFAATGSSDNVAVFAAVIEGPFKPSPLDKNIANTTADIASPFTCPATGVLTQAQEVVMVWGVATGSTVWAATSPNLLAGQAATAAILHTVIGYQAVSATTTISPEFTAASNPTDAVLGTSTFMRDDPPYFYGQDPQPQPPARAQAVDRAAAIMAGDSGINAPKPLKLYQDTQIWPQPPPLQQRIQRGAIMPVEPGIEAPFVFVAPVMPPLDQRLDLERPLGYRAAAIMASDAGISAPKSLQLYQDTQIWPQPPVRPSLGNRAAATMAGDHGTAAPQPLSLYQDTQAWPQPPRFPPPGTRASATMAGDPGIAVPRPWVNLGFEPTPPLTARPKRYPIEPPQYGPLAERVGLEWGFEQYESWPPLALLRRHAYAELPSLDAPQLAPAQSGTGALVDQASTVSGTGISFSPGTSALADQAAALAASGISGSPGTGSLADSVAVLAAAGLSASHGAAALAAQSAIIVGVGTAREGGIGALAAQAATLAAVGQSAWDASGNLASGPSQIAGIETDIGRLSASASTMAGSGASGSGGTGHLYCDRIVSGTGDLVCQAAMLSNLGGRPQRNAPFIANMGRMLNR